MKRTLTLLLLGAAWAGGPHQAQAQCHYVAPVGFYHHTCHHHDSCSVEKPFVPGRIAGFVGALGAADRRGTSYAGGDIEGYYWLRPRWAVGLRGTITGEMPAASGQSEVYGNVAEPRLLLYSITWSNTLLIADAPRWRLAVQAGLGLGGVNLYDHARQVKAKGQKCGCTTAELMASATAPVTEVGLTATYKLKGNDAPWLTLRGGYRQWNGTVPFGTVNQFSPYVVSLGISMPDAPPKRK
jgi:hypothetical protein